MKKELVVPTPTVKSPAELFILAGWLSKFISPDALIPTVSRVDVNEPLVASNAPLSVVAVTTPATFTLSNSVCPSTSKSPVINCFPYTVTPTPQVWNFLLPRKYNEAPSV